MGVDKTLWTRDEADLETLVTAYYGHVAAEDLRSVPEAQQRQRVEAHMRVAAERTDSAPRADVVTVGGRSIAMVVTDDMPHLVDSVTSEISRQGHAMALVVHPILLSTRAAETRQLVSISSVSTPERALASGDTESLTEIPVIHDGENRTEIESWSAVELDRELDAEEVERLIAGLYRVVGDVKVSHRDQARMVARARGAAGLLRETENLPEAEEAADLLEWMGERNFLFLGYREYVLAQYDDGSVHLEPEQGTGLGILSEQEDSSGPQQARRRSTELSPAGRERAQERRPLIITKANSRSTVRRSTYMDYVAVKTFFPSGEVRGERRFLGLFSRRAYTQSITNIPLLRERARELLARSGISLDSHAGSDLMQILETYPRNELMQMDIEETEQTAWEILQLQERRRVRLFLRMDHYGRFMTALLYMPRDRYNTAVRRRVEEELLHHIDAASLDFNVMLTESVLARVFFRMRLNTGAAEPTITEGELQQRLARAIRSWPEGIAEEAADRYSRTHADHVAHRWGEAFPDDYRVLYEVPEALGDIAQFEALEDHPEQGPRMRFYAPGREDAAHMRLKLYLSEPKTLTDTLPVLDDFGLSILDERSYTLDCGDGTTFHLYDLGLFYPGGVDPHATIDLLSEAYSKVLLGRAESDIFSRLVLQLGMNIRKVTVLRAYAKYMRQLGSPHSYDFLAEALLQNPAVSLRLIDYFEARFDPELEGAELQDDAAPNRVSQARVQAMDQRRQQVVDALEDVPTLDADRVLSTLLNLMDSTWRTNLYQDREWVSMKLTPGTIDTAPYPRPAHEIWVYAPEVEGVHLRFAKVARGGLRWSDRQEDFRTEVLGLVKAQEVKNSVIVPSGAKGGFYAKQLPDPAEDRGSWFEAGREAYTIFIRGLLDITDNQIEAEASDDPGEDQEAEPGAASSGMQIVPPERVVRHDGEDPYLVVAADKGTATFSDTANAISEEYGHWLGDAFASGGSVGYDHKAMGITARGAWESVKSHFSELGVDTQSEEFTAVAVGDMGGDVFGNGMLCSEHTLLVAAFNHLHIFIDPNPDAQSAHQERQRLFTAQKSGWDAYDTQLISEGGGVFSRSGKTVPVTEQMRERFGLDAGVESMSPPELINAVLRAPVDLIYNGGIGTYVKASTETHEEVGDRSNNLIRVDGRDLEAKVVGEGGNLGLTQAGRIEAAHQGVRLNTDAIDNSGGVESSDYEVNIKILIDQLITSGHLSSDERSELLAEMTDDVAELVLQTNRDQNVLLLTDNHRMGEWSPSFKRLMSWLEDAAGLDRQLEVLPDEEQYAERGEQGLARLTSPELAVLTAYAKIQLKGALVDSSLPDEPWFDRTLGAYFPDQLSGRFAEQLPRHPLSREIVANSMANDVINMGGATFVFRAMEETFAQESQVVRAFVVVRELFRLSEFDAAMRELPVSFSRQRWAHTYLDMRRLLDRAVRWFVNRESRGASVAEDIEIFAEHIGPLYGNLGKHLRDDDRRRVRDKRDEAVEAGMPEHLAAWVSELFEAFSLLDVAGLARQHCLDSHEVAGVYYAVYAEFDVDTLLNRITSLPRLDKWQALARGAQRDELYRAIREITESVLLSTDSSADPGERLAAWKEDNVTKISRAERLITEVDEMEADNIASLTVLLRHLRGLIGA